MKGKGSSPTAREPNAGRSFVNFSKKDYLGRFHATWHVKLPQNL